MASSKDNVSAPANYLRRACLPPPPPPAPLPCGPAPPSPVCRELCSSHVEDYPCRCSLESPQTWHEVSGNATWAFSFFPSPHAPWILGGGEQLQLSQPHTDQPPRTLRPAASQTGPAAPTLKAAEPEVRRPEVALSLALDGLSLPQSGPAQPHLDGSSAPPLRPPPPLSWRLAPPLPLRP